MAEETFSAGATTDPIEDLFARGIELFNREEFFEAHEVWEEAWHLDRTEGRSFYQGLIQVAGGFHHLQNGNVRGSYSLLRSGLKKLEPYADGHGGIDLGRLRREANAEWEKVTRMRDGGEVAEPVAFPRIAKAGRP